MNEARRRRQALKQRIEEQHRHSINQEQVRQETHADPDDLSPLLQESIRQVKAKKDLRLHLAVYLKYNRGLEFITIKNEDPTQQINNMQRNGFWTREDDILPGEMDPKPTYIPPFSIAKVQVLGLVDGLR